MSRVYLYCLATLSLQLGWLGWARPAQAQEFRRMFEKGRVLLERRLFADAIQELYPASQTTEGKRHSGVHYHLGKAYFQIAAINLAFNALQNAVRLAKNDSQRQRATLLLDQIRQTFGQVKISLEADPDEIGKVGVQLETTEPFSNRQKRRSYRILSRKWKKGMAFSSRTYFIPKGTYRFGMEQPKCLSFGFFLNGQAVRELVVGDSVVLLSIKDKPSCVCEGGQVLKKDGKKRYCTCPNGTLWSQRANRCEIPKNAAPPPSWIAKNWPWVTALTVVVVAAGVTVPLLLVMNHNADLKIEFSNGLKVQ
ncbi:MAG: hypothetical protein H6727_05285 [Myxococcales bacterium]|nr:hypothetical protein [Myxococcales bacterium]